MSISYGGNIHTGMVSDAVVSSNGARKPMRRCQCGKMFPPMLWMPKELQDDRGQNDETPAMILPFIILLSSRTDMNPVHQIAN